jgi:hypothetical protein
MSTATVCDKLPETPVTVTLLVAGSVDLLVVRVMILVPVALAELNVAVTPAGSPDTVRLALPLKLPLGMTKILVVPVRPWGTDIPSEDASSAKSAGPAFGEGSTS